MANYQQTFDPNMRGVLFKNDKKGNEKRPDYRGSCVINNVDMNISGWIQTSKKTGDKFMSLRFEAKSGAWSTVLAVGVVNYMYKFTMAIILTPLIHLLRNRIENYVGAATAQKMKLEAMGGAANI